MARFTQSVFGQITGKLGGMVAAVRKDGTCILKEYRKASNPNSEGQQKQRGKFGFTMKKLNCLRGVFADIHANQYGINRAVSQAMKSCVYAVDEGFVLDFSELKLTSGVISSPVDVVFDRSGSDCWVVSWGTGLLLSDNNNDELNIVVLNTASAGVLYKKQAEVRQSGCVTVQIPFPTVGEELYVWLFFSSATGRRFSDSVCFYFPAG